MCKELNMRYDMIPKPKAGDKIFYHSNRYGNCEGEITCELPWFFGRRYRVYLNKSDKSEVIRFKQIRRWSNKDMLVAWNGKKRRFVAFRNEICDSKQFILTDTPQLCDPRIINNI